MKYVVGLAAAVLLITVGASFASAQSKKS